MYHIGLNKLKNIFNDSFFHKIKQDDYDKYYIMKHQMFLQGELVLKYLNIPNDINIFTKSLTFISPYKFNYDIGVFNNIKYDYLFSDRTNYVIMIVDGIILTILVNYDIDDYISVRCKNGYKIRSLEDTNSIKNLSDILSNLSSELYYKIHHYKKCKDALLFDNIESLRKNINFLKSQINLLY